MSATPIDRSRIPEVLEDIASGSSLRSACEFVGYKASTFLDWVAEDPQLAEQYARARTLQAEHYADEIVRIADSAIDAQKARLQVDARKWVAAKLLPKKYGDKLDVTSGGEKLPTVTINVPPLPDANG
jgi:hypothetical protein